jgi:hypothetical protein
MSDQLQPGQHPDANQLNAFVEHALPLHEQEQTLAHLAICADCRQIVYLSQPPDLGESVGPQTIAARRPWFASWNVAWPMAVALASVLIFTIHLHNTRISIHENAITTTAQFQTTSLPAPTVSPGPISDGPKPTPGRTPHNRPIVSASVATSGALADINAGSINGTSQPESVNTLPLGDRKTTTLSQTGGALGTGSLHGSAYGSAYRSTYGSRGAITSAPPTPAVIGGLMGPGAAAQAKSADTGAVNRLQQKAVSTPSQSNQVALSAEHAFNPQDQVAAAPPLMVPSTAAAAGVGQTVEVVGTISTIDAAAFGQSQPMKELPTLPSHLPVLSVISNARQTLAIDTNGTLFLSNDGASWRLIESQWTGRAVKVRLAPFSSPGRQTAAKDTESSNATHGRAMGIGASIASTRPLVFELTTDAGVVWASPDGQTWKQK